MNEAEWLSSDDPGQMLYYLIGGSEGLEGETENRKISHRQARLFACACCRLRWENLGCEATRNAVTVAELYADGLATEADLKVAHDDNYDASEMDDVLLADLAWGASFKSNTHVFRHLRAYFDNPLKFGPEADLLRDIVGNPFRPVTLPKEGCILCGAKGWHGSIEDKWDRVKCHSCDGKGYLPPTWLAPFFAGIVQAAYDSRDFGVLPILADGLEEAGCTEQTILDHLRGPGLHCRGCFAVDLLLGKE